jgi:hypothetical protein
MYILLILHVFILFHLSHLNEIKFYKKNQLLIFITLHETYIFLHQHIAATVTLYRRSTILIYV